MPTDPTPSGVGTRTASGVVLVSAVAAFLAGALSAVQSRANGTLAGVFGSVVDTALWSFGSGWLILSLAMLHPAVRGGLGRSFAAYRDRRILWWQFFGGLIGAMFVFVQSWAVPQLGVALFTIAIVGGQTVNALVVDGVGLGPAGRTRVTPGRVVAALGTFVGVAIAMLGRDTGGSAALPLGVIAAAVAVGAAMAVQQAINGRVNGTTGNVLTTSWINFTWGLFLIGVICAGTLMRGSWRPPLTWDAPPWAFAGGVLGIVFVAVGAVVVHHLGVLLATLLTLAGQLIGAVLVDVVSAGGSAHVGGLVLVGVAVTLVSSGVSAWVAQRGRRVSPGR